jgi:FtsP/CotA-like multicopper oxidase with cupredoxin domain
VLIGTEDDTGSSQDVCDASPHSLMLSQRSNRYRLRLINSGTFASIRFSIDGHPLRVVEADATPVVPFEVAGVLCCLVTTHPIVISLEGITIAVAQRYSVLLNTNQTVGSYWIRAELDRDMFKVALRESGLSRVMLILGDIV